MPVAYIPTNHVIGDTGDNKYLLMQRYQDLQISQTWLRFFLKHLFIGQVCNWAFFKRNDHCKEANKQRKVYIKG